MNNVEIAQGPTLIPLGVGVALLVAGLVTAWIAINKQRPLPAILGLGAALGGIFTAALLIDDQGPGTVVAGIESQLAVDVLGEPRIGAAPGDVSEIIIEVEDKTLPCIVKTVAARNYNLQCQKVPYEALGQ